MQSDYVSFVKLCIEMFIIISTKDVSIVNLHRIICLHSKTRFPRLFSNIIPLSSCHPPSKTFPSLTFLHSSRIKNLKHLAYLSKKYYLCGRNGRKGLISRMSDECLMKQEFGFPFYVVYQAVMRKFTLA